MAMYAVARSQIQPWVTSFIIARQATAPPLGRSGVPGRVATCRIGWVAQISLLRSGCFDEDPFARRNPDLKSEIWATHSIFVRSKGSVFG
jgi:hypothetical protein